MAKRRKPLPTPLLNFRVFPERRHRPKSRLFFRVKVFRTVGQMQDYLRRGGNPRRPGRFCKGMASTYTVMHVTKARKIYTTPECGEIVLAKNWCRIGLIAHEAAHAVFGLALRRKFLPTRDGNGVTSEEERYCYALGDLTKDICWRTRNVLTY